MKKTLLVAFLACSFWGLKAQDTILTTSGKQMVVTITLLEKDYVRYTDYPATDGYEYKYPLAKVSKLSYFNGNNINLNTENGGQQTFMMPRPVQPMYAMQPYEFQVAPPYKNPAWAFVFSLIPGVGQFYNDQIGKGIVVMSLSALTFVVNQLAAGSKDSRGEVKSPGLVATSAIMFVGTYVFGMIDAVSTSVKLNKKNGYVLSFAPSMSYGQLADGGTCSVVPSITVSFSF